MRTDVLIYIEEHSFWTKEVSMGRRTGENDRKAVAGGCALPTGACFVSEENQLLLDE